MRQQRYNPILSSCCERYELQLTFPELVIKSATRLGQMPNKYVIDDHRLYDAIATPFWENRAFVIAWFSSGLYVFQIRRIWRKDEGLLLLIAKHYSKRDAVSLFKRVVCQFCSTTRPLSSGSSLLTPHYSTKLVYRTIFNGIST